MELTRGSARRPVRRWSAVTAVAALALAAAATAAPAGAADGPAVTVTPNSGLNADGDTLTVTGSGFDPNKNNKFGVYVVFGPHNADYATNANAFQVSKWVHPGATPSAGQDNMNADGTFTTTLNVTARYTDGDGNNVDCTVIQCKVITMAAHGLPDRSQDTFTPVSFGTPQAPAPALTVTPATGADRDGQTFTISGTGFDPVRDGGMGIYVAFGPKRADWTTNAAIYQATRWVRTTPSGTPNQAKLNADGSFSLTLENIKPVYTAGNGEEVDCLTEGCYVVTFAAHGSTDRSQDTYVPITWAPVTPDPTGPGQAYQVITADVAGGPLTLTAAGTDVTLPQVTLSGQDQVVTARLNDLTVKDARGTNAGWNLTGQASDLTAGSGRIVADNVGWAPSASVVTGSLPVAGQQPAATPGAAAEPGTGTGLGQARTLCSAPAGASAGAFTCGGDVRLGVPGSLPAGTYTGTLTLTLI